MLKLRHIYYINSNQWLQDLYNEYDHMMFIKELLTYTFMLQSFRIYDADLN